MTSFYDSCIDDFNYPKTFLIFNSNQIYPEYLIQF
uniref:PARP catalytic domain-containing protein n=2 Tax=Anguilla TaxID=7935 RepID=A0A0E9UIE7_ANGAN